MQIFVNLITRAIFMSTPLVLGALGEVLAERTGMMVTAIEGIFLVGAWGGFIGAYLSGNLLIGFLLAMVCGLIVSLLYGVTTIYMHQHQICCDPCDRMLYIFLPCDLWYPDSTA